MGTPSVQTPVATSFSIFSKNGRHELAHVITYLTGAFSVALHPGNYSLVPDTLVYPWGMRGGHPSRGKQPLVRFPRSCKIFDFQDGPCAIFAPIEPESP